MSIFKINIPAKQNKKLYKVVELTKRRLTPKSTNRNLLLHFKGEKNPSESYFNHKQLRRHNKSVHFLSRQND